MFRLILSQGHKTLVLTNLKSNFSSTVPSFPEINQVTLVGTLISDPFILPSGTRNLSVKMINAESGKYEILNVHTKGFEMAKAGQRVHVSGKLRSTPIELENGKKRDQVAVKAHRIFILDNSSESENAERKDMNQINIVANVVSNVAKNSEGPNIFNLATHFNLNTDDGVEKKAYFHSVFVYDENLKKLSEDLKPSDKVAIQGEIRTSTNTQSDGKKKYNGFIVAKSIEKVKRRQQQQNQDDAEHEANN